MNGLSKIKFKNHCIKCIYKNGIINEIGLYKQNINKSEDNYNFLYNMIVEFKPEDTEFNKTILSHLENDNNIISQYGPEMLPSFMNDR